MTIRTERIARLRALGWTRLSARGSQSWRAPDPHDRGFYTLAAAAQTVERAEARARRIVVTLETADPDLSAVKRLLKALLRRFGLRCVQIREETDG
jgi:hypothetical protein